MLTINLLMCFNQNWPKPLWSSQVPPNLGRATKKEWVDTTFTKIILYKCIIFFLTNSFKTTCSCRWILLYYSKHLRQMPCVSICVYFTHCTWAPLGFGKIDKICAKMCVNFCIESVLQFSLWLRGIFLLEHRETFRPAYLVHSLWAPNYDSFSIDKKC